MTKTFSIRICSVPGCRRPHDAKNFCKMHGHRFRRYGDPLKTTHVPHGAHEAFVVQALAHNSDECLPWPFGRAVYRYGAADGRTASNLVCERAHGKPRKGRNHARHTCDNTICVNPRHLLWGSHADNMHDAAVRGLMKKPWAIGKPRGTKKPVSP